MQPQRGDSVRGDGFALARLAVTPGSKESDRLECAINFFERFLAKVRDAQQVFWLTVEQVFDVEDAAFFETIGRAHREADLGHAHYQVTLDHLAFVFDEAKWNPCHCNTLPGFMKNRYCIARSLAEPSWFELAAL
jgi:hypothetical protein